MIHSIAFPYRSFSCQYSTVVVLAVLALFLPKVCQAQTPIPQDTVPYTPQDTLRPKPYNPTDWDKLLEPYDDLATDSLAKAKSKARRRAKLLPPPSDSLQTYVGVYGGLHQSTHTGNLPLTNNGTICCSTNGGESQGINLDVGVVAFLPIKDIFYFSPRLGIEERGGLLKVNPQEELIRGRNDKVEKAVVQKEMDIRMKTLHLDAQAVYSLLNPLGMYVGAGFSMGIPLSTTYMARERLLGPPNITYFNGSTVTDLDSRSVQNVSTLNFSLRGSAGVSLWISNSLKLNIEGQYHHPLTNYSSADGITWKSTMLMAHVGLLWEIGK